MIRWILIKEIVIFDIDGILADTSHRFEHFAHKCNCFFNIKNSYHEDQLLTLNYEYYKFFQVRGYRIVIFTSRSEQYKYETRSWLRKNNIQYETIEMRTKGDYRPAYLVKRDFLTNNFGLNPKTCVKAVFEDDIGCIQMYRSFGLKVYDCKRKTTPEITPKITIEIQRTFRYSVYM